MLDGSSEMLDRSMERGDFAPVSLPEVVLDLTVSAPRGFRSGRVPSARGSAAPAAGARRRGATPSRARAARWRHPASPIREAPHLPTPLIG